MRRYSVVDLPDGMRGWVIHWEPGEDTGWHDHGESLAKIVVVRGVLVEERRGGVVETREWGISHISYHEQHRVVPYSSCTALHIYVPELTVMNLYDDFGKFVGTQSAEEELGLDAYEGEQVESTWHDFPHGDQLISTCYSQVCDGD